jgi:hypothetical protein
VSGRVSTPDARRLLSLHAADVIREENFDPNRLSAPGVRVVMARAMSRLNRRAKRALGERGAGLYHPLANARTIPGKRRCI